MSTKVRNFDLPGVNFVEYERIRIDNFIKEANKDLQQELEIRFGFFIKDKFIPGVSLNSFDKYITAVSQWEKTNKIEDSLTLDTSYPGFLVKSEVMDKMKVVRVSWKKKIKVSTFPLDIPDYNIRFGLSKEIPRIAPESPGDPLFFRHKQRTSYEYNSLLRYDFTIVKQGKTKKEMEESEPKYEVEIEYLNGFGKTVNKEMVYNSIVSNIETGIRIMQDNFFVMTETEKSRVITQFKEITKQSNPNKPFFSFIGPQPVSFKRNHLALLKKVKYSVTEKADGDRAILFINNNGILYIIKSSLDIVKVGLVNKEFSNTLIDGEFLNYKNTLSKETNLFLSFDISFYKNRDLKGDSEFNLEKRHNLLKKVVESKFGVLIKSEKRFSMKVEVKEFRFGELSEAAEEILKRFDDPGKRPYEIDGLIYTPVDEPYPLKNTKNPILKWKPPELNTIDFLAQQVGFLEDKTNTGKFVQVWHLRVSTTEENAGKFEKPEGKLLVEPIKTNKWFKKFVRLFQPSGSLDAFETVVDSGALSKDNQRFFNNTVIEFRYSKKDSRFIPIRTRWDKTNAPLRKGPNFETIALDTWNSIIFPVTRNDITTNIPLQQLRNESIVINMRRFHNWVKSDLLSNFEGFTDLLDLSSGKGGDILKWNHIGFDNVIGFDIDRVSVLEAKRRLDSLKTQKKLKDIQIQFFEADLGKDNVLDLLISKGIEQDFDAVSSQFAFHYFFKSESTLDVFLTNVSQNLREDGIFVGTAFNGLFVFRMLKGMKKGETFVGKNGETVVFEIKKLYSDPESGKFKDLPLLGNKIEVTLKGDTVLNKPTIEYLINFKKIKQFITAFDLEIVEILKFGDIFNEWKEIKKENILTKAEKQISFLNVTFIMRKLNKSQLQKQLSLERRFSEEVSEEAAEEEELSFDALLEELQEQDVSEAWESLDGSKKVKRWEKLLQSDKFVKRDCGGAGDCQFFSIAFALNLTGKFKQQTPELLRNKMAEEIRKLEGDIVILPEPNEDENFINVDIDTLDEFNKLILGYRLEVLNEEFRGDWDPFSIEEKEDLINEVLKTGFNFEGDNASIALLAKSVNRDFIIFDDRKKEKSFYQISGNILNKRVIGLFYTGNHYQLVGFKENGDIKTTFRRDINGDIPELKKQEESISDPPESIKIISSKSKKTKSKKPKKILEEEKEETKVKKLEKETKVKLEKESSKTKKKLEKIKSGKGCDNSYMIKTNDDGVDFICNPDSGKWVKLEGRIGTNIYNEGNELGLIRDKRTKTKVSKKETGKTKTGKTSKSQGLLLGRQCDGERGGWTVKELRELAEQEGIIKTGIKKELCDRLIKHFKKKN